MMRQSVLGGFLAALIIAAWVVLHVHSVFFQRLSAGNLVYVPLLVIALCWLNVGLFIIAHDAMHGSLFPRQPTLNRFVGALALTLYAAFRFERLKRNHMAHHRAPGTTSDPDFAPATPTRFAPWYLAFMRRYFGLREFLLLCVPVALYLIIGADVANLLLFWALPAALSSVQLFFFGTYLPHRDGKLPFADPHHARSTDFGWVLSLISCFHFGYHYEHHASPHVPWWGLPLERRRREIARSSLQPATHRPHS